MNKSYTGKRSHHVKSNLRITRQKGFFSLGIGLGLSALFALFGTVLEPGQEAGGLNNPIAVQEIANNARHSLMLSDADLGQHGF